MIVNNLYAKNSVKDIFFYTRKRTKSLIKSILQNKRILLLRKTVKKPARRNVILFITEVIPKKAKKQYRLTRKPVLQLIKISTDYFFFSQPAKISSNS